MSFGHALEGNLHFVFTPDFNLPEEVKRYESFMDEVCELVAGKLAGSLKAEHGPGRNMAPFVEKEWGREAYALMKKIKQLFDPESLLSTILKAPAALLIGPEGGFDDAERAAIRALPQAVPIGLGPRILRAETAAIAATALWMAVAGDWAA